MIATKMGIEEEQFIVGDVDKSVAMDESAFSFGLLLSVSCVNYCRTVQPSSYTLLNGKKFIKNLLEDGLVRGAFS